MLRPGVPKSFQGKSHDVMILEAARGVGRLFPARFSKGWEISSWSQFEGSLFFFFFFGLLHTVDEAA